MAVCGGGGGGGGVAAPLAATAVPRRLMWRSAVAAASKTCMLRGDALFLCVRGRGGKWVDEKEVVDATRLAIRACGLLITIICI